MSTSKKIIDSNPASYPRTSTPEYDSVVTLIHILNKNRVKFDLNILDKIPNTDGIFELVTESQIPIGKIDIQVKILEKKNHSKPKYQCNKEFLSYCEESILPVLLVVVNVKSEVAYWVHISRNLLEGLSKKLKGKSINVDIPKENLIAKNDTEYLDNWKIILKDYQTRIINYSQIEKELEKIRTQHDALKKISNPALGIERNEFKEIHLFLDYYDELLNKDFSIVKDIFYKEYWKFGIAYSDYSEKSLQYSLYPIMYTANDIQIKEINHIEAYSNRDFLNYVGHYKENPIKKRPLEYAYKYVIDDLKKLVDDRIILPIDTNIAIEYLFYFIDKNQAVIGLENNALEYSIPDLEYGLKVFFPAFCETMQSSQHTKGKIVVDLDFFRWRVMPDEISRRSNETRQKLSNGFESNLKILISSKDFNLNYLQILINHLKHAGHNKIKRPYPLKNYPNKQSYFIWQAYRGNEVKSMVESIFKNLLKSYETFIDEYFNYIKNKIQFFSNFNRLIINLKINESATEYRDGPGIEMFYLRNLTDASEQRIDVYLFGTDESPIQWGTGWKEKIKIESNEYQLISSSSSMLDNVYHDIPLQDYLFDTLKNRLQEHLKPFSDETSIFKFTRY